VDTPIHEQRDAGLDDADAPRELRFARRSTLVPLSRGGNVADYVSGEDVSVSGGMVIY
jgi:hypothetical protein